MKNFDILYLRFYTTSKAGPYRSRKVKNMQKYVAEKMGDENALQVFTLLS
jgi:hypothetical protein